MLNDIYPATTHGNALAATIGQVLPKMGSPSGGPISLERDYLDGRSSAIADLESLTKVRQLCVD